VVERVVHIDDVRGSNPLSPTIIQKRAPLVARFLFEIMQYVGLHPAACIGKCWGVGLLAQLVERLVYTENVGGSSPSRPTISP
jgi:hypothetical protein